MGCIRPNRITSSLPGSRRRLGQLCPQSEQNQQNKQDEQNPRNSGSSRRTLENCLTLNAANLLLAAAAPKQGQQPTAEKEDPWIDVAPQNTGRLSFSATTSRTC